MLNKKLTFFFFFLCFCFFALAQKDQTDPSQLPASKTKKDELIDALKLNVDKSKTSRRPLNPLAPARAAFFSAVLPGLGQAYNKRYWKIPIVYAALGTGVFFYIDNNKEYNRFRDAFKRRLAGFSDDEFQGRVNDDGLINAQETLRRRQELSLLITIGLYALNIIDANVDAHLLQFNVDDKLSFKPHYKIDQLNNTGNMGVTMSFKID